MLAHVSPEGMPETRELPSDPQQLGFFFFKTTFFGKGNLDESPIGDDGGRGVCGEREAAGHALR